MNELEQAKNLIQLGTLLRDRRKELGLSLQDVQATAHINWSNIAKIERAEVRRPQIDVLSKLAKRYGLESDLLIGLANKIPQDVYWKVVQSPKLIQLIRNFEV